ncbi:MAG: hypothetical protein EOP80_01385 [Variovorax sp.]|nr:MAG: hypothetical protein EOP80_01385 [Variovorax sp.]
MNHLGMDGEFERWIRATDEYANHLSRHPSLDSKERQRLLELANGLRGKFGRPDDSLVRRDDPENG